MASSVQPVLPQATVPVAPRTSVPKTEDVNGNAAPEGEFSSYLATDSNANVEFANREVLHQEEQIEAAEPLTASEDAEVTDFLDPRGGAQTTESTLPGEGEEYVDPDKKEVFQALTSQELPKQRQAVILDADLENVTLDAQKNLNLGQEAGRSQNGFSADVAGITAVKSSRTGDMAVTPESELPLTKKGLAAPKSAFELVAVANAQKVAETGEAERIPSESRQTSESPRLVNASLDQSSRREPTSTVPVLQTDRTTTPNSTSSRDEGRLSAGKEPSHVSSEAKGASVRQGEFGNTQIASGASPSLGTGLTKPAMDLDLRGGPIGSFADLTEFETVGRLEVQTAARSSSAQIPAMPELRRHVFQQLSSAISVSGGKTTEVALNPAELGRVRISLNSGDAGLVVSIVAERPETLDLMRRNAAQLVTEFSDIGYSSVEFSFGQGGSDLSGAADDDPTHSASTPPDTVESKDENVSRTRTRAPLVMPERVDIRL